MKGLIIIMIILIIIIIIGFYIAQIFSLQENAMRKHTPFTSLYIHIHIIYTQKHSSPTVVGRPVEKRDLNSESVKDIPKISRQQIPDRKSSKTERVLANRFEIFFSFFQKPLVWGSGGA